MPQVPIREDPAGVILAVLVVPGASRSQMMGPHGETIRIRVSAPPEKGRASRAAEKLLERFFGVPVTLVAGATSRRKQFLLEGMDAATASRRIREEWG